ncbi:LytTR family DNA-binding domain-containing protein, partial [Silanimonas sp.]|uniref:LytTR family DNA-binding domain-containing protein n=1 Tax=Silanimonas sp. TaxID=1929290 RepID=UPI0037C82F2E
MPRLKVWVWWIAVSCVLALLLMRTDSDVALGLPPVAAFLVWFVQVALGLGVAIAATWWLGGFRSVAARPPLFQLLVGGLIGSLVFAPLSLGLEAVFPSPGEDPADGWLDALEQSGGVFALVAEWLQLAPAYLTSWAILNVPPTFAAVGTRDAVADARPASAAPEQDTLPDAASLPEAAPDAALETPPIPSKPLLARIPAAIGTDLVFARSDLHYLQLRTTLGSTTLLGTIAEIEAEMGDHGLRVHRSFWVALSHVRR